MDLKARDSIAVWHPYTQVRLEGLPVVIKSAKGSLLFDEDGKSYIDGISSWWVNLHGHSNPAINSAITETLAKLDQVIFAGFTHEPAVSLAEKLISTTHKNNGKVFFSDDGSTAVEAALKMTMQYWSNKGQARSTFISFEGAYHGDTFGAMSVSERGIFNRPFQECLFKVQKIKFPLDDGAESLPQLKQLLKDHDVAGFIFEPLVQGASGMNMCLAEALDALISECNSRGIVTIADEVFTGFYRTGKMLASDYLVNKPDIYCFSKGLSGGVLPLGATVASDKIFEAFLAEDRQKMFLHGHSYTANPLSCAAGNASFDLLCSEETKSAVAYISKKQLEFSGILKQHPKAKNVRVLGTILAFEIESGDKTGYLSPLRDRLYNFYIESGVLLRPLGNTVYILPPYCIEEKQLEYIYSVIIKSLDEVV